MFPHSLKLFLGKHGCMRSPPCKDWQRQHHINMCWPQPVPSLVPCTWADPSGRPVQRSPKHETHSTPLHATLSPALLLHYDSAGKNKEGQHLASTHFASNTGTEPWLWLSCFNRTIKQQILEILIFLTNEVVLLSYLRLISSLKIPTFNSGDRVVTNCTGDQKWACYWNELHRAAGWNAEDARYKQRLPVIAVFSYLCESGEMAHSAEYIQLNNVTCFSCKHFHEISSRSPPGCTSVLQKRLLQIAALTNFLHAPSLKFVLPSEWLFSLTTIQDLWKSSALNGELLRAGP